MTAPNPQARRATIEDLQKLMPLWQQAGLPAEDLGKRFQEFQVIEGEGSEITAVIGLQIAGNEARLHSEAFARPEEAESLRSKLWERVQMISKNHGFVRLWTQSDAPFWEQNGFQSPPPEIAQKLPPAFAGLAQPWRYIQLRTESGLPPSVEKEFAIFKEMQKAEREQLFQRAKTMKIIAVLAVLAVFAIIVVMVVIWMTKKQALRPQ